MEGVTYFHFLLKQAGTSSLGVGCCGPSSDQQQTFREVQPLLPIYPYLHPTGDSNSRAVDDLMIEQKSTFGDSLRLFAVTSYLSRPGGSNLVYTHLSLGLIDLGILTSPHTIQFTYAVLKRWEIIIARTLKKSLTFGTNGAFVRVPGPLPHKPRSQTLLNLANASSCIRVSMPTALALWYVACPLISTEYSYEQ